MVLEIRTYRVAAGRVFDFVSLMRAEALPLLAAHQIDVVACDVSLDPRDGDPQDAFLIRAFDDQAARERAERGFYSSSEWRDGPREAVLALIETFHTAIFEVPAHVVDGLRR